MTFRRSAPAVLIGSVAVVTVVMAVLSNRMFSGMAHSVESDQLDLMRSIIEFNLRGAENRALAGAEMLATLPTIRDTFAKRDRPRLLEECKEMFRALKERHGVDQAQFHVPPSTSFLRLQAPDRHGDDLSKGRPMVVEVNRTQVPAKGLAIARTGPAIFGVVPVRDAEGKHIGSVELGLEFGPVLDNLKSAYGLELALFVEEADAGLRDGGERGGPER